MEFLTKNSCSFQETRAPKSYLAFLPVKGEK